MTSKFVKMGGVLLLVLIASFTAYSQAYAERPHCSQVENSEFIFEGNVFEVTWVGSPRVDRVFVVWPLDDRMHWAAYELFLFSEDGDGPLDHHGAVALNDLGWRLSTKDLENLVDDRMMRVRPHMALPVGIWPGGQLIIVLTDNSGQDRHEPPQDPPLCKANLELLEVLPIP